jgi:hypothetical protein
MSVTRVDTLAAVTLGATTLTGVRRKSVDPAIQMMLERMGGANQASFAGLLQQDPGITYSCTDIARQIGVTGISTLDIPDGIASVISYWGKVANKKTYTAGSAHDRERVLAGMICPLRINAQQGRFAEMDMSVLPIYDGTNNPIILDTAQALPTGVVSQAFTLGPVSVNGTTVDGGLSATLNFGFQIERIAGDGDTWPTFVATLANDPTIELSTPNRALFNQLGLSGGAITANVVLYLRSIERNKKAYSNASTQHIKFTVVDGVAYPGQGSAEVARRGDFSATIVCTTDGTNAALQVATGSAIT